MTVNVAVRVVKYPQLSVAVNVTVSGAGQLPVIAPGALLVYDAMPEGSVAVKAAIWDASQAGYAVAACVQDAEPFWGAVTTAGGALSGCTTIVCVKTPVLPDRSVANQVRVKIPP